MELLSLIARGCLYFLLAMGEVWASLLYIIFVSPWLLAIDYIRSEMRGWQWPTVAGFITYIFAGLIGTGPKVEIKPTEFGPKAPELFGWAFTHLHAMPNGRGLAVGMIVVLGTLFMVAGFWNFFAPLPEPPEETDDDEEPDD